MDEDERRKRLSSGREMLKKFKAERAGKSTNRNINQSDELSEEESLHNEKFVDQQESFAHEALSSRDITHSSMSEGEADGYLEGMAGRLGELEEILQGKGAIIESLYAEIESVRAEASSSSNSSQSQNSNVQLRDLVVLYRNKVDELEAAVKSRDDIIDELTLSLTQALNSRDSVVNQIKSINSMQMPNISPTNSMDLQKKINQLETTLSDQRSVIDKLNGQLLQIHEHVKILETEKENLNQQIMLETSENTLNNPENLDVHKKYDIRIEKMKHQQELKDLKAKFESELINIQRNQEEQLQALKEENKMLLDRLNKELPNQESQHAKELSVFQSQLANYKKTVEALKSELVASKQSQKSLQAEVNMYKSQVDQIEKSLKIQELAHEKERDMLNEQIELHKLQISDVTAKYVSANSVMESKESLERSLEQALTNTTLLKKENEELKFKLDDLSSRYSAAQTLIESNQARERMLSTKMYDLERSLARFSGFSNSTLSELNETSYMTLNDSLQDQLIKKKLEEKAELERLLVEKISTLEEDVCKKDKELDQANLTKKSYEKQLKDMKNMCDKLECEVTTLKESISESSAVEEQKAISINNLHEELERHKQEVQELKNIVKQRDIEITDYNIKLQQMVEKSKKSNSKFEELKKGLVVAWKQCASFQDKLNQTGLTDSEIDMSQLLPGIDTSYGVETAVDSFIGDCSDYMIPENIESWNKMYIDDTESAQQIETFKNQNESLLNKIDQLQKKLSDYNELERKCNDFQLKYESLLAQKQKISEENNSLKQFHQEVNIIQQNISELKKEKIALRSKIEETIKKHKDDLNVIKVKVMTEVDKMQSLFISTKEDHLKALDTLKQELDKIHADEMEDTRKYFEQRCLQIEKQYSEDIFSLQSKKMSDNDSETEELTEDLYLCGAGDCLSVSRSNTPGETELKDVNISNKYGIESDYKDNIKILENELELKMIEIQNLKVQFEKELNDQRTIYERKIRDIQESNIHPRLLNQANQHCQTEDDSVENFELSQLRNDYNRQLEEQLVQIRVDVVNELKEQIQSLLNGEEEMSSELLELRDKFTSNKGREMEKMKETHALELKRIKEEADRNIAEISKNYKKELEKFRTERLNNEQIKDNFVESDLIKERNNLHKCCMTLKALVGELIRYFIVCEEEVNNTLISEVLRRQFSDCSIDAQNVSTEQNRSKSLKSIKRVHFAPLSSELQSIISEDIDVSQNLIDDDITDKLKKELNGCLHRLKVESAEVIGCPLSSDKSEYGTFLKDNTNARNIIENLNAKLAEAEKLIVDYQEESEHLKMKIFDLQHKLINAECKKEIISEGYGEHDESGGDTIFQDFSHLQEKARHALSNGGGDSSYLLQLIEGLSRESDKIVEDAKKEREDLQQQIEAADKQLRGTRKFLDEQAGERELERDEFARQIESLQEQLKERERDKERDLRITSEQSSLSPESPSDTSILQATDINADVEALESQMRQMSTMMSDIEGKKSETENKLKTAVDNILYQQDIIANLEQQLQSKLENEDSLQMQIDQLEAVIAAQTKNQEELAHELDAFKMGTEDSPLNEHISHLEEELRKHKLSLEHFDANSSVLKQLKIELRDMQSHLDKRIKELESVHICGSNLSLSHPSEDVSIRDQIDASRCPTPDDPDAPLTLPLDLVLKVKEKMQKHFRVEEVVLKRIRDLEIQVVTLKNQNEEMQAEHEILQQTTSEQLFQIEAMKGRLEQHKQNAPFAQRQATSRLELQLHETNAKLQLFERILNDKELELNELRCQLERTSHLLQSKEKEIANVVKTESLTIKKLKDRLQILEEEKKILESRLGLQERAQLELPQLIDNILADKNEEIDHLKEQLSKREKQLDAYSSMPLEEEQQSKEYLKQMDPKASARTLSDILSIHSECEDISEAIRAFPNLSAVPAHNISTLKPGDTQELPKDTFEMSSVPLLVPTKESVHIPPLDLGSDSSNSANNLQHLRVSLAADLTQSNEVDSKISSIENKDVSKESSNMKEMARSPSISGKFKKPESTLTEEQIKELENQLGLVRAELRAKAEILEKRDTDLAVLQKKLQELQAEYKETIDTLTREAHFYKNHYELIQVSESKIKNDLLEVENTLKRRTDELQEYKSKIQVNENIIVKVNSENEKLKKNMKDIVMEKDITIETLQTRNIEIENENKQLYEYKTRYEQCKLDILVCQEEIQRLTEGLKNREEIIRKLEEVTRQAPHVPEHFASSDEKDRNSHNNSLLRRDLSVLREEHKNLEAELCSVKAELQSQKLDEHFGIAQLLETEQRKYLNLVEEFEREQRKNAELFSTLTRIEGEKNRYIMDMDAAMEEKEQLIDKLTIQRGIKERLEVDLKKVTEELKAKENDCEWLKKRIEAMNDMVSKRQSEKLFKQNELKGLRKELHNAREVMLDLEADMKQSKRELAGSAARELALTESLDEMRKKEAELQTKLNVAMQEEARLRNVISNLTEDLKDSIYKELDRSKHYDGDHSTSDDVNTNKELNNLIKKYITERNILNENLIQLQIENEQLKLYIKSLESQLSEQAKYLQKKAMPNLNKLQHFYGKYLRVDSRRKALAYQKRYLLSVLGGYQHVEENTIAMLAHLTLGEKSYIVANNKRKSPKKRFRSAVLLVISIHRMKLQVIKWKTNRRTGVENMLETTDQSFVPVRRSVSNHSPPVRERFSSNEENLFDSHQYYERFRNIQRSLGLAKSEFEAANATSD